MALTKYDILIKGGIVIDGMRNPRYGADIGILDGKIKTIGRIHAGEADRTIDATGLIVAPGFIDLHTHYDSQIYWDPWCTISGWHGVTSVVVGNCGFGFAPVKPEDRQRAMLSLSRNEAVPMVTMEAGMTWDWETYPEFLDSLDKTAKGVNVLSYMGLSPLMMYVMGVEAAKNRRPTEQEMKEMCNILDEAMEAGCCGFSAQVLGDTSPQRDYDGTPMITDTMAMEDLYHFAEVLRERGEGFSQFMGGGFEMHEKVAEISGRPVIYNVMTPSGKDQHGRTMERNDTTIAWLKKCNEAGLRIYAQVLVAENTFDFTMEDWNLYDSHPLWREFTLGSAQERRARMEDPAWRERLKEDYALRLEQAKTMDMESALDAGKAGDINIDEEAASIGVALGIGGLIVQNQAVYGGGLTVGEIAEKRDCHVLDAFLDVALEQDMKAVFTTPTVPYDMDEMAKVANADYALPGLSDGGAHTKFVTLGAYTTEFMCDSVRDAGVMSLEDAHWRLSGYPAMAAGFRDRGTLKEGAPADIIVYDLENLAMGPRVKAEDFPGDEWRLIRTAEGYRYTIVNGEVTFEDGECTGATPGSLLRHGDG